MKAAFFSDLEMTTATPDLAYRLALLPEPENVARLPASVSGEFASPMNRPLPSTVWNWSKPVVTAISVGAFMPGRST